MTEEQSYERMLQALKEMQSQIEERVRPVIDQVVQVEIDRLHTLAEQHQGHLKECLARIDQSLLSCQDHLHKYRQARSELLSLNQRLADLGADPETISDGVPSETLSDIIAARLEGLKLAGKI